MLKMSDRQVLDDFFAFLEEHNYCKVTCCDACYYWGDKEKDKDYCPFRRVRHCRCHHIATWPDDYCSDALEVKHE